MNFEDMPDEFEEYECSDCKNRFFVEHIGIMQDMNRPSFCPYCGAEFEWFAELEDELV